MKKGQHDFYQNWYEIWMNQTKEFYDTAYENLQSFFKDPLKFDPEENQDQISHWLKMLKSHWHYMALHEKQKANADYWKWMMEMNQEACERLIDAWKKRTHSMNPVKDIRELYELWLNACHEVYTNAMHSKSYQEAYGKMINAALEFWKKAIHE